MPKADYTDYYDRARFELTWVITSAIFIAMVLFSVTATVFTPEYATIAIISIFLSFLMLVNLWFSRKFRRTAVAFVVLGIFLSVIQLFIVQEMLHLVDLIWFFVIALFSFFTLGMMWGLMTVFAYISSLILYILFFLNQNISTVVEVNFETKIAMVVNAALAGILLFYVVYKFYTTNKFAEKKYHIVNRRLIEKNQLIKKKNEANEIMLKEIHHRVKNNLQIITSLLRLQSSEIESEESEVHFREAIDRVAAMAMIHEKLYQEDLSKIELDNYIRSLIVNLIGNYAVDKDKVRYVIDVGQVSIDIRKIVPLALILNELVSNSLKHGSTDGDEIIDIHIHLNMSPENISLNYHDKGKWKESSGEKSFGLQLIDVLCSQLDGEYSLDKEKEIDYRFTFIA